MRTSGHSDSSVPRAGPRLRIPLLSGVVFERSLFECLVRRPGALPPPLTSPLISMPTRMLAWIHSSSLVSSHNTALRLLGSREAGRIACAAAFSDLYNEGLRHFQVLGQPRRHTALISKPPVPRVYSPQRVDGLRQIYGSVRVLHRDLSRVG